MRYAIAIKEKAIKRLLEPERPSIAKLSVELDIPEVTLYYWERQLKNGFMGKKLPSDLTLTDKHDLINTYHALTDDDKGIWLREQGIFEADIKSWREEINFALLQLKEFPKKEKELKKQNEILTKELTRKEKALAEVTALLVFKKKLQALYGEENEETQQ